jgi:hypothetical protein
MAAKPTNLELQLALNERNAQLEAARLRIAELEGDLDAARFVHNREVSLLNDTIERWRPQLNAADELLGAAQRAGLQFIVIGAKSDLDDPAYISEPFAAWDAAWREMAACGYPLVRIDIVREETKRSAKQNASAPKRVYEFDPAVPGDFVRASNEAKKNGGMVRRQTGALR